MPHRLVAPLLSAGQSLLLAALPAGGQTTARRNAWAAMSSDAARARARREAATAMAAAELVHGRRRTGTATVLPG